MPSLLRRHALHLALSIAALGPMLVALGCAATSQDTTRTYSYESFAVAADHSQASEAGAEILAMGGNAVDAAVATSFALSVARPFSCGIGGGSFMLIHLPSDPVHGAVTVAIDCRERAPQAVGPDYFEDLPSWASSRSGHAVAVPGHVAGMLHALERYGTLDRQTVLAPAIRLAREGVTIDDSFHRALGKLDEAFAIGERPGSQGGEAFLRRTYLARRGSKSFTNPEMARALELIARDGASAFYEGEISQAIVEAVQEAGGSMTREDLARYYFAESDPLTGTFAGRSVLAMPLPSSGGVAMLETLALLEQHPAVLRGASPRNPDFLHLLAEAFKHAFADRAQYLGDPEFMDEDPTPELLNPDRIRTVADRLDTQHAREVSHYGETAPLAVDAGTSHVSVIDAHGGAVACTDTINLEFGSKVAVAEFGFCLNNEMDDFTTIAGEPNAYGLVQSERNLPEPGKRPLSSMTPTIVVNQAGEVEAILGASGGPRIITGVTQVLLNVVRFDLDAGTAVGAPRLHHQWLPDRLQLEQALGQDDRVVANLARRGHQIGDPPRPAVVQLIRRDPNGGWQASSDHRKGGRPAGH